MRPTKLHRSLLATVAALGLTIAVGGCSTQPVICNMAAPVFPIDIDAGSAQNVQVCESHVGCAASDDESEGGRSPSILKNDDGTFTVEFSINPPAEITINTFDTDGIQLDQQTFPLIWSPEPQYERCGPESATTDAITL